MYNRNIFLIVGLLLFTFFTSCKKDEANVPKTAPEIVSIWPESGTAGIIIKINGYHFSPERTNNKVKINGKEATVIEASYTELQVVTPEGAGTGKVTLSVNGDNISGPVFTYTKPPVEYIVSTFAGSGNRGYKDGSLATAAFDNPEGVAIDASGAFIITDRSNHCIRKISNGKVTTIAGVPEQKGFHNGPADQALFNYPYRPAIDKDGNIIIADRDNNMIRKISTAGVVSTIAGKGADGYVDGPGNQAMFNQPIDVAVDDEGNIYVADNLNACIRKITPDGTASTLAGNGTAGFADGTGSEAMFDHPSGVAIDAEGNIIVADRYNNRIRKVTPEGVVTTVAGSGSAGMDDGPASYARFHDPYGVAVGPDGSIYVADLDNHKIRKISPEGMVTTVAGSSRGFANGTGMSAQFYNPTDICVDASGVIYVADMSNNMIRKIRLK